MLRVLLYLVPLVLVIFAFIDCLNTPEDEVRHLPKIAWVFIILLFWIVGPIVWLIAGKDRAALAHGGAPPGWQRGRTRYVAPDDNPEFLKSLDKSLDEENRKKDEQLLRKWEADLRRREEELRRKERGEEPKDG
ncbi:PLD nuclease N-terminal domain-containing protein [Streptomyces thermoalcalitolerans]|uniref:PLD nuclease N-terminal domain-containing protein n=1 Tax=Streptomyces thermoalcalitolerans TaxID=65605 RepID=A0ABN1NFJ6_9ACTN